jgi:TATA-box binding protein (TBP) (component of TFIID and TFIIIB)
MFQIVNIKISAKIKSFPLSDVTKILKDNNIPFKEFTNFVSFIKDFNFIVFKTGSGGLNHANITNLKKERDKESVNNILSNFLRLQVENLITDNIVVKSTLNQKINLIQIIEKAKFQEVKYNPERFPGLFIRFNPGTCIVFHSGKIIIVGCKNIQRIENIVSEIHQKINSV